MDLTRTNFGELLFALNFDPLIKEMRNIERINKRTVQTKNGIFLIKYIYMYTY